MSGLKYAALGFGALGFGALGFGAFGMLCAPSVLAYGNSGDAPSYKVDASWPKQLPNNWVMGQVGGMAIDGQDHLWVLQRPRSPEAVALGAQQKPPISICCVAAPAVLEFDAAGNVMRSWGAPGFVADWPKNEHAIHVDKEGNVWISGNGRPDRQILKFSADGKQLLEIGHPSDAPTNNQDTTILGHPAGIDVDDAAHEVYIADGYQNSRVVVYDSETGRFKRGWGAYGIALDQISNGKRPPYVPDAPPSKQFSLVHCVTLSTDGFVYVCDRINNRIQVFHKDGKFVKEFFLRRATLGVGSLVSIALSPDKDQKYLLVADDGNSIISVLRRSDGVELAQIGHRGHDAGQFDGLHQIVIDSKGTLYSGEAGAGMRLQKFVLRKRGK